jgi:hypothetical protein
MRAVRGGEGVVNVDIAQLGKRTREVERICFLSGVEAKILKESELAWPKTRDCSLRFFADTVRGEDDVRPPIARLSGTIKGRSEKAGSRFPLGRPKWDITMTLALFAISASIVGASRSIRVASVTTPFLTGTFRSARSNTRFPFTSMSSRVRKFGMELLSSPGDRMGVASGLR